MVVVIAIPNTNNMLNPKRKDLITFIKIVNKDIKEIFITLEFYKS
jgi:hypothetical protein